MRVGKSLCVVREFCVIILGEVNVDMGEIGSLWNFLNIFKLRFWLLGEVWFICENDMVVWGGYWRKELLDLFICCCELMFKFSSLLIEKLVVCGLGEELVGSDEDGDSNFLYGYIGNLEYFKELDVEVGFVDLRWNKDGNG